MRRVTTYIVVSYWTEDLLCDGGECREEGDPTAQCQEEQKVGHTSEGVLELLKVGCPVSFPALRTLAGGRRGLGSVVVAGGEGGIR